MNKIRTFNIKWKIDIDASSVEEAAQMAREIMLDPTSIATHLIIYDELTGQEWEVNRGHAA